MKGRKSGNISGGRDGEVARGIEVLYMCIEIQRETGKTDKKSIYQIRERSPQHHHHMTWKEKCRTQMENTTPNHTRMWSAQRRKI